MNTTVEQFARWEMASRDIIVTKKIYIDLTGDLIAGMVLSDLVYWSLPTADGRSKLRVFHEGEYWIAARYTDWQERLRITPKQAERAIGLLVKSGMIIKAVYKFNGTPMLHLRIDVECIMQKTMAFLDGRAEPPAPPTPPPPPKMPTWEQFPIPAEAYFHCDGSPVTETTTETNNHCATVFETEIAEPSREVIEEDDPEAEFEDSQETPLDPCQEGVEGSPDERQLCEIEEDDFEAEGGGPPSPTLGVAGLTMLSLLHQGDEVKNPRALAALQAFASNKQGADIAKFPADIVDLAEAFMQASNLAPGKREFSFWIKALRQLREDGLAPIQVREAVKEMRAQKLTIKSPASIRTIALDTRAKRKSTDKNKLLFA